MPNFEALDARIASALNRITHISHSKRRISLEEQKAQKEENFRRGRRFIVICGPSSPHLPVPGSEGPRTGGCTPPPPLLSPGTRSPPRPEGPRRLHTNMAHAHLSGFSREGRRWKAG